MSTASNQGKINFKSVPELYDFIIRMCDRNDLFGHLTVFERMLATSDFVANICVVNTENDSSIDALTCGHLLWSMYFDKFTAEFYEKGGWSQLKTEVKCYKILYGFYTVSSGWSEFCLQGIKEAVVNFCHFKNAICYQKQKHHPVHISVLWIQFRIEHCESYINIPSICESSVSPYEADLLLDDLKIILDPARSNPDNLEISKQKHQNSTSSTEMSYSEIHSILGERKVNQDDETQIQYSGFKHEVGSIDKVSEEFSHISTNSKESQIGCQNSAREEITPDIIVPKENLGSVENTHTEKEEMRKTNETKLDYKYSHNEQNLNVGVQRPSETSIKKLSNTPDFDLSYKCASKSYMNETENSTFDYFYKGNAEECDEIINTDEEVSILQAEETKYQKKSFTENDDDSRDLSSTNALLNSVNKIEKSKEMFEMSPCSKIGRTEIVKSTDNSSSSKIIAHERNGKISSKGLTTLKDLSSIKENTNNDDEILKIRIARTDLRKEQRDPEVKKFLRMLQVLGDREGAKFVLSTLQNIEGPENTQERSNKQNKKHITKGTDFESSTLKNNKEYPEKSQENINLQKKRCKKKRSRK